MATSVSDTTQATQPAAASASTIGGISEVSAVQVAEWLKRDAAVLIDVREPDEHAREHIRGAQLLPLSRFGAEQAAALAQPGQRIVLHCKSGRRSAEACRMAASLAGSGRAIYSLTGGIEGWKSASLPVVVDTGVSVISVMRQVQLVIGLGVLGGSALAWFVHPAFVALPAFFGAGLTFAGASGTCALATVLAKMPWNRLSPGGVSCATGGCA